MWRYLVGACAVAAMAGAAALVIGRPEAAKDVLAASAQAAAASDAARGGLPARAPEATAATREERRFARYDKDRDGGVTREEYVAQRRKAYAKLDVDHDGRLSFDEWAVKATTKFSTADRDRSGQMTPKEFATTAVIRKPDRRPCPPTQVAAASSDEEG